MPTWSLVSYNALHILYMKIECRTLLQCFRINHSAFKFLYCRIIAHGMNICLHRDSPFVNPAFHLSSIVFQTFLVEERVSTCEFLQSDIYFL